MNGLIITMLCFHPLTGALTFMLVILGAYVVARIRDQNKPRHP